MIIKWLTGLIKGERRREKVKVEIEELKKAILEDPKFRDEILRELEYRTGRRDILKAGVLGLLGLSLGVGGSYAYNSSVGNNTVREVVSDYTGVKIPKPCTCIVAQDGTGDYDVSPGEDASEVIQKAIDYAHKKGGGEVRIREGKYTVKSAHLSIPSNIWLEGSGNVEFSIMWGGYFPKSSGYALITNSDYVNDYINGNENIVIRNIRFVTDPNSWPVDWGYGTRLFVLKNVKNVIIEDCYFSNHCNAGELYIFGTNSDDIYITRVKCIHNFLAKHLDAGDAILKVQAKTVRIRDCYIDGGSVDPNYFAKPGYNIHTDGGDTVIEGCKARRCKAAIWIEGSLTRNCRIINNDIRIFSNCGIGIAVGTKSLTDAGCMVSHNYISNYGLSIGTGIKVGGVSGAIVDSNIIKYCSCGIALKASQSCNVYGNVISNITRVGILIGGKYNIISNNNISGSSVGIQIQPDRFYSVSSDGIHNIIKDNIINATTSIRERLIRGLGIVDYNIIIGNKILPNKIIKIGNNTIIKENY